MKAITAILMTLILAGSISVQTGLAQEQEALMSFKANPGKLTSALPSEAPDGYEKLDQWIDTSSYSPVFVVVRFSKPVKVDAGDDQGIIDLASVIEVSIGDHAGFNSMLEPAIRADYNYQKKVKVKGKFDGRESVSSNNKLCIGSEKVFVVNNRYLVNVNSSYMCDLTVLDQIIDYMDLDKLLE